MTSVFLASHLHEMIRFMDDTVGHTLIGENEMATSFPSKRPHIFKSILILISLITQMVFVVVML